MIWRRKNKIKLQKHNPCTAYSPIKHVTMKVFTVYAKSLEELESRVNQNTIGKHVRDISIKVNYSRTHKYTIFISHLIALDGSPIPIEDSYTLQLKILSSHDEVKLLLDVNIFMGMVLADAVEFDRPTSGNRYEDLGVVEKSSLMNSYVALITYRVPVN